MGRIFQILIAAVAALVSAAQAQEYPAKPITFYVPFAAGSATDTLARSLGQGITAETKQPVVNDNRPGANGIIAAQAFIRTPADGYTVLIATNTTHAANEHLYKKIPYHPVSDFTPVTTLARACLTASEGSSAPLAPGRSKYAAHSGSTEFGSIAKRSRISSTAAAFTPKRARPSRPLPRSGASAGIWGAEGSGGRALSDMAQRDPLPRSTNAREAEITRLSSADPTKS